MPSRTWADLDVPTAADLNTQFRDQVITSCTSGTRPGSPVDGRAIFETDTRRFKVWSSAASAWQDMVAMGAEQTYTPSWTSTGTAPTLPGSLFGGFQYLGAKTLFVSITLTIGASTTFGTGGYRLSLPPGVTAASTGTRQGITGTLYDASVNGNYALPSLINASSNLIELYAEGGAGLFSGTVPVTLANGDAVHINGVVRTT